MKYTCEICGCSMDSEFKMLEHEKQCRVRHENLILCVDRLNTLIKIAANTSFGHGLVVEVYDSKDNKPTYYTVKAAELDGKNNRCIIQLKYENTDKTAVKSTAKNRT